MKPRTKKVRVGVKTTETGYKKELRNIREILKKGYYVELEMVFRGKEVLSWANGAGIFAQITAALKNEARPVNEISLQGRTLSVLLEAR
jgi:translation initiation factor IF-3